MLLCSLHPRSEDRKRNIILKLESARDTFRIEWVQLSVSSSLKCVMVSSHPCSEWLLPCTHNRWTRLKIHFFYKKASIEFNISWFCLSSRGFIGFVKVNVCEKIYYGYQRRMDDINVCYMPSTAYGIQKMLNKSVLLLLQQASLSLLSIRFLKKKTVIKETMRAVHALHRTVLTETWAHLNQSLLCINPLWLVEYQLSM